MGPVNQEGSRELSTAKKLMMGLVVTLLVLGAAELALRAVLPLEDLLFSWERPDNLLVLSETGEIGLKFRAADQIKDGPRPWNYVTNKQGFREALDLPYKKPEGQIRLLAFGDSFMFGINANQGASLVGQLEDLLPEALGVEDVEVVNIGVPGSSAFDMLTYWRRFAPLYEHDGVLLGQPHNPGRQKAMSEDRKRWYSDVRGPPPVDIRLYMAMRRFWAPYAIPAFTAEEEPRLQETMIGDIKQIAKGAAKEGKRSWLVLWPERWETVQLGERKNSDHWVRSLNEHGTMLAGHSLSERSCWGYDDTGHPSEAGYRATAEVMARLMTKGQRRPPVSGDPRCSEVPGDGPGKPGSLPVPTGPTRMQRQHDEAGGNLTESGKRGAP